MAAELVELTFRAELGELRKQLAQMPDIGDTEAKKMVNKVEARYNQMTKAAKKATKSQEESFGKTFKKIGDLGKEMADKLSAFGPAAGAVAGLGEKLASLGEVAGPLGLGLGVVAVGAAAAAVAVYGAVKAAFALADAGVAAVAELDAMHAAALVPAEVRKALEEYSDSQTKLTLATDLFKAKLGSELAPVLTDLLDKLTIVVLKTTEWIPKIEAVVIKIKEWSDSWDGLRKTALSWLTLGISDKIFKTAEAVTTTDVATQKAVDTLDKQVEVTKNYAKNQAAVNEETKRQAEIAKQVADQYKEHQAAIEKMKVLDKSLSEAQMDDKQKLKAALIDQLNEITKLGEASEDYEMAWKLADQAVANYHVELTKISKEENEKRLADAKFTADAIASENEAYFQKYQQQQNIKKQADSLFLENAKQVYSDLGEVVGAFYDAAVQRASDLNTKVSDDLNKESELRAKLNDMNAQTAKGATASEIKLNNIRQANIKGQLAEIHIKEAADQKAYLKAKKNAQALFLGQKAMTIASIGLQTAEATMAALLPPPVGLGPFTGPSLWPLIIADGAIQAGLAAAQPMPKFFIGGTSIDETPALLHSGEGIVNRRGMDSLGKENLQAVNEGKSITPDIHNHIYLDGKYLTTQIVSSGSSKKKTGRSNPHANR